MAKLTYAKRKSLPKSSFAEPGKRAYPIDTPARGRNALSRVSEFGDAAEKKTVRGAVKRKYPGIK